MDGYQENKKVVQQLVLVELTQSNPGPVVDYAREIAQV